MIAVINYGAGNLPNAVRALEHVGAHLTITDQPKVVREASAVVLPGVGATNDTMRSLEELQLIEPIRDVVQRGTPFLGICVGMQVLAQASEEWGLHPCLELVPGTVRRFPAGLKVPQIGWNQVTHTDHPLWDSIPQNAEFYFVHSYYIDTPAAAQVIGHTVYGQQFPSALAQDNLIAVQFHPEKSGRWGLQLLHNWVHRIAHGHHSSN